MTRTANDILENKELRNELMNRTEVLGKVKELFLLPGTQAMTMTQVADFYGVEKKTVEKTFHRHRDEVELDGIYSTKAVDLASSLLRQNVGVRNLQGYKEFEIADGVTLRLPNNGKIIMFPTRAILRIGMLLRDSEVAKEVRTQLLNTSISIFKLC